MYLEIVDLGKTFKSKDKYWEMENVSFSLEKGKFLTLLGPSGCGKSTTLRCIAGLETPEQGSIILNGRELFCQAKKIEVPPQNRKISMVFQSYALWPHMNVMQNVSYGYRIKRIPEKQWKDKVLEAIEILGLEGLENRYPAELSGGQQQRVALARAVCSENDLLLLDEPLSNLDAKLRESARLEIIRLQKQMGSTIICVTHNQEEALAMSDEIVIIDKGIIQQIGSPKEIYTNPNNEFVADFIGSINSMDGIIDSVGDNLIVKCCDNIPITVKKNNQQFSKGDRVRLMIRPEDLVISSSLQPNYENVLQGKVEIIQYLGEKNSCMIRINNQVKFMVSTNKRESYQINDNIWLHFQTDDVKSFK